MAEGNYEGWKPEEIEVGSVVQHQYPRVNTDLYRTLMLKAADDYGWDKSQVTDEYIDSVYKKTGGDIKRYLSGIYKNAGVDTGLLTDDKVTEILDSYGVVDKVNIPSSSDVTGMNATLDEYRSENNKKLRVGGLVVEDGGVEEDVLFSTKTALDALDEYYNERGMLTPYQKEAIASRRWKNAQKGILEKYGDSPAGRKRLDEEYNKIIADLDLEVVDGVPRVKMKEREAYDLYYTGASVDPQEWDKTFKRAVYVQPEDYAENARLLNEEFEKLPKEKEEDEMPLLVKALVHADPWQKDYDLQTKWGKEYAAMLFNGATIRLYERMKDSEDSSIAGNLLKGTGEGILDFIVSESGAIMDIAKNKEVSGLNLKIGFLIEKMPEDLSPDEKRAKAYEMLTPREQNLLNSFSNYYGAVSAISPDVATSRRIGQSVGESLGFMAEFILSGGGGWLKGGVKAGGKALLKSASKKLAKRGMNQVSKFALNVGERLGRGDHVRLFLRPGGRYPSLYKITNKFLNKGADMVKNQVFAVPEAIVQSFAQPSLYVDAADRMAMGEDAGKAFSGALYDRTVENWSERLFVGGGKVGKLTGEAINFGKLKGARGILEFARGTTEEFAEELAGDFVKRLPEWKEKNFTQAYMGYWGDKWDTFLSVSLMTGVLGGGGMIGNKVADQVSRMKYEGKSRILRKAIPEYLADEIDGMLGAADIDTPEALNALGSLIEVSARANNIPKGKLAGDVSRYIGSKMALNGLELVAEEGRVSSEKAERKSVNKTEGTETGEENGSNLIQEVEDQRVVEGEEESEKREKVSDLSGNSISLQENKRDDSDEISEQVSQGEYGTEAKEVGRVEEALFELERRSQENEGDAQEAGGTLSRRQQKEVEARAAEDYAKEKGIWIPMEEVFSLGEPAPSGNENDVYFNSEENSVYKVNNLMNSGDISSLLERIKLHNQYFPDTQYELVGFSGFGGRDVYPVLRQRYIENSTSATPEEIETYMKNLGFERVGEAKYANEDVVISDLRPRNVLKDADGDFYVIDAEFEEKRGEGSRLKGSIESPIGRSLSAIEAQDLLTRMSDHAETAPELELTPENWMQEFGEDGMVDTPLGKVKMGENQYFKLAQQGRNSKLGMIKPTLVNPDVVVEDRSKAGKGETERGSSYVFIKSFLNKNGERNYLFTSVTIQKEGKEVVISNQEKKPERIKRLLEDGRLAYIKEATLPSESGTSTQGDQHTNPTGDSSIYKGINNSEENQGEVDFSPGGSLTKRLDSIVSDFVEQEKKEARAKESEGVKKELEEIRWNVSRKGIVVDVDGKRVPVSRTKKGGYNTKNEKAIDVFERELGLRMEKEKRRVDAEMEKRLSDYNEVIDSEAKVLRRNLEEGKIGRKKTMEAKVQEGGVSLNQANEIKRKVKEAYNKGKGEVTDKINAVRSALGAYRGLGKLSDIQYKNILKKLSRKNANVEDVLDDIDNMIIDNAFRERAYTAKVKQQKQADVIRKKVSKMMLPDWLGHDVMERFIMLDTDNMTPAALRQYEVIMADLAKSRPKFNRFIPDFVDEYEESVIDESSPKRSDIEVSLEKLQAKIKEVNSRIGRSDGIYIGDNSRGSEMPIEEVNSRFNEKLEELTEENADGVVLSLGMPNDVLRSAGISNKPMKLYGNKVVKKMKKHGFGLDELKNLPEAVADPIAVFDNLGKHGNRSILTELRTKQGNFLVTVDLGKDADIDFNIISSVFGKGDNNVVDWINKGFAIYINKKKAHSFLSHQSAPIAAAAANEELSSATNIVKNFENPIVAEGEISGVKTIEDYRNVNREVSRLKNMAARWYEKELGGINEGSDNYEERVKAAGDSYQGVLNDIEGIRDQLKDISGSLKKELIEGISGKDGNGMLREAMGAAGVKDTPFEEVLKEVKRFGVDLKGFGNLEMKDLVNLETALFNASIGIPTRDLFTVWSKLRAKEMGKRLEVSRGKIEKAYGNKRVRKLLDDVEKLKDVIDMHDFSMVDAIFDAGSGKDLYEDFFVPQIERAVVQMDKKKALTLKDFGDAMQKLENFFVLSKITKGTPLKRLAQGDVQRYRDLAGMIMTQLDYESNVSVPFEDLADELKDYFGYVISKTNVPKNLKERTKDAYQFMRFGEDGRLDVDKTLEAVKDEELAGILREVMDVARNTLDGGMRQYYVANAVRRGMNMKMMDHYFPRFVRKSLAVKTDGEIDFENIYSSGKLMPTMLPGSLNKRMTKAMPNPVEIDVARVMKRAAEETLTDYFLAPAFAQANSALVDIQKDGGKAAGAFEVLRQAMKDRLVKNYRKELSKDDIRWVENADRLMAKMARTLLLAKIPKTVAEFASNQIGSLISDGTAGWSYWGKIDVLHELADAMNLTSARNIVKYNEMYRDVTGNSMSLGEKGVNKLITINDEWTSSAIYYKTFNKLFEGYSGEKFDYEKAKTDEEYRKWVTEDHEGERSYFERAHIGALTRAQESFTTVNRALGATHTRFLFGAGKMKSDSFAGRAFGFMMSFNTNERFEFMRGWREFNEGVRVKDRNLMKDGAGRMASRFVRGAVYAAFMQQIAGLIVAGLRDDKDTELTVNPNLLAGTCMQLALGRYGNTGGMLLNVGLGALKFWDRKVNGNTKLTDGVVDAINNGAGIYAMPISTEIATIRTIEKVFPHWGFMMRIFTDSPEMMYDIYKKNTNGESLSEDEQMLWGSLSLMNAVFTMIYPNPVTTTGYNISKTVERSYKKDKYEERNESLNGSRRNVARTVVRKRVVKGHVVRN